MVGGKCLLRLGHSWSPMGGRHMVKILSQIILQSWGASKKALPAPTPSQQKHTTRGSSTSLTEQTPPGAPPPFVSVDSVVLHMCVVVLESLSPDVCEERRLRASRLEAASPAALSHFYTVTLCPLQRRRRRGRGCLQRGAGVLKDRRTAKSPSEGREPPWHQP